MRRITDISRSFILAAMLAILLSSLSGAACADKVHECSGHIFETPLSGEIPYDIASGTYYLTDDCYITRHVEICGEVSICLNGHTVEVEGARTFHSRNGGTLNLYDCTGEGVVGYAGGELNNHPITVDAGGTVNIFGGRFYAKNNSNAINSEGTVNIYGGTIESETDYFCAIRNYGTLNIYGGTLIGDDCVWQRYGGTITLAGNDFCLNPRRLAIRYALDEGSDFSISSPLYMWRASPDADFISSEDAPFEKTAIKGYLEFRPMRGEVTLDYAGGSGETQLSEYLCGTVTALPDDPIRDGYTFDGWRNDESGELMSEISADARGAQAFTAVWAEIPIPSAPPPEPTEAPQPEIAPVDEPIEEPQAKSDNKSVPVAVFIAIGAALLGAGIALKKKK